MAHFALLWKARTIEKYRQNYENEKINSIIMSSSDVPDKTLLQRWRHYKHGMQKRLSRTFSKWYPEGSTVSNFFVSLKNDMKLPSILLRSLYGFVGGLLLTYLGFMFFVFQLSVSVMYATVLSSILGVLLTLGLTFSNRMRCLIFLLVPQLFSRVGRYTLTCYALVLILTGPATNTLKNSEVLSESMACSQEQIKLNVRQINDSIKKPFNSIKNSLKTTVKRMNEIVRKLKITLIRTNKLILSIASIIQSGYFWLGSMADACNDALGTPHQKCLSILKEHCGTCDEHYNLNDIKPKNVTKFSKNAIRDILHAIGIKNIKPKKQQHFNVGNKKHKDETNFVSVANDIKHSEDLKEHNTTKKDSYLSSTNIETPGDLKDHTDTESDSKWSPKIDTAIKDLNEHNDVKSGDKLSTNTDNEIFGDLKEHNDAKNEDKWSLNIDKEISGDLKEHNDAKIDDTWSPSSEDNMNSAKSDKSGKLWFCDTAYMAKKACASLLSHEKFCVAADFAEDTFLATIRKNLKTFVRRIGALIHVQLNIQHTYTFIGNSSSSNQVPAGIVTEIRNRADPIFTWLSWSSCVTSLFLLLIIFRAKHYQHMFETRSRFDNRFITKEFRELDLKRLREGRQTVLPLNTRERAKYVTTTSFRLVASEKLHLNRSAVFMTVATFKLLIHIVADYSLYWVLTTIQHHGKLHSPLQPGIAETGAFISGSGFVARLLQAFVDTMNVQLLFPPADRSCLPNPYPPDIKRYCQIGFLIFLLWFFALFEPFGLRMRHLIMGHYRPQRAKDRAVWLYNHILRTRASFMKFARRKLHREYKYSSQSKQTLRRCLRTHILFRWLYSMFGIKTEESHCLLCNISEDTSDHNKELIKCEVPNCPGTYCACCFSDIGQLCTICLSPSDYGDFSDVSLEKGSSDEGNSDDDSDPNDNPSGSCRRKSSYDYYTLEDANEDGAYSRKSIFSKQRQLGYFFGRRNMNDSDTLPLLKHHIRCYAKHSEKQKNRRGFKSNLKAKAIIDISINEFLLDNVRQITGLKVDKFNSVATSKGLNDTCTSITLTTMEIIQYSLYEITNNPLKITKSEYTTNVAKYLRKTKLIRHKKYNQKYSKYFMTCSNNNINTINKNTQKGGDKKGQDNNAKDLKQTKKDEKNDIPDTDLKGFYNEAEFENFGSKNDTVLKMRKHNSGIGEFHTTLSKYWKNVISTVLLEKSDMKIREKIPPNCENKHKRKKKRKINKNFKSKEDEISKLNKKEEVSGNSRLFAFLDERDWVNCENNDKDIHTAEGEIAMKNQVFNNEKVVVNNIAIPRLKLDLSAESINPQMHNCNDREISATKKRDHAIERFIKSMACNSCDFFRIHSNLDNVRDECCYNEANDPYLLSLPGHKQDSEFSNNSGAFPGSFHASSLKDLPEYEREFNLVRISHPLLLLKKHCSSFFERIISINKTNPTKTKNMKRGCDSGLSKVEAQVQTVRNKIIQCNTDKHKTKNVIKLTKAATNVTDKKRHEKRNVNKYTKEIQTMPTLIRTDDKETTAFPQMTSCGCQHLSHFAETQDFTVQVNIHRHHKKKKLECKDEKIMTCIPTCTCASQCHKCNEDVGTAISKHNTYQDDKHEENSDSSTTETSVFDNQASKTDTTVCSCANVDYRKTVRDLRTYQIIRQKDLIETPNRQIGRHCYEIGRLNNQFGRLKVKVVTKSNRSTLTDRQTHCDVSTATCDWWSPLVERKNVYKKERLVEKRWKDSGQSRLKERGPFRNRGTLTGEKMVSFRSKAQFIPIESGFSDILSPSRYLLESQRYYNELFYNLFASPRVYTVTNMQKHHNLERDRSQISSCHHRRRGRKTKRLEESYSPRKDIQPQWIRRFEPSRKNKRHNGKQ